MPSATENAAKSAQRLPAWKRLGLKLKSASESATEEVQSPKRKQSPIANITASKRVKVDPQVSPRAVPNPNTPSLARKKSVSFTPETKVVDGDSIKQLFNGWVTEQKEQDPSFELKSTNTTSALRTVEAPSIQEQVDTSLNEKERRVKRVKVKEKKGKKAISKPEQKKALNSAPPRPFLQYLHQYHNSRETWKFNKNHQNHLLKHAFDVSIVPSDHSILLYEYIRGLQGGVRTRLRDTALKIKIEDQEASTAGFPKTMADKDRKQQEYDFAMKEYVATMMTAANSADIGYEEGILLGLSDDAMFKRTARRMRSERILAELAAGGYSITDATPQEELDEGGHFAKVDEDEVPQKLARKRKQRTIVVESSSSESDSHSGSDAGADSPVAKSKEGSSDSSSNDSSDSSSDSNSGTGSGGSDGTSSEGESDSD